MQLAVDSGYATTEVYEWARQAGRPGAGDQGRFARAARSWESPSPIEVGPLGVKLKRGVKVWPVNSGMAKEELYRWLRLERPTDEDLEQGIPFPPGYCHFPRYSEEYFKQITAEQLVREARQGLPPAGVAEDARAQRGAGLPGVRARGGGARRAGPVPGEALARGRGTHGRSDAVTTSATPSSRRLRLQRSGSATAPRPASESDVLGV